MLPVGGVLGVWSWESIETDECGSLLNEQERKGRGRIDEATEPEAVTTSTSETTRPLQAHTTARPQLMSAYLLYLGEDGC